MFSVLPKCEIEMQISYQGALSCPKFSPLRRGAESWWGCSDSDSDSRLLIDSDSGYDSDSDSGSDTKYKINST